MTKTDFDAKLSSVNRKITINKSKHLPVENELKRLKTFDSSYFSGKNHFVDNDGTENYLVFQPMQRYFKMIANTNYISSWKSKGLPDESMKPPPTSDNSLSSLNDYCGDKIRLKFNGDCLQQSKLWDTHGQNIKIYIVYELTGSSSKGNDPTVRNSLFGAVRLTKSTDIVKYRYSGYGIAFDRRESFSFPSGGFGIKLIIFRVDMKVLLYMLIIRKRTFQFLEKVQHKD